MKNLVSLLVLASLFLVGCSNAKTVEKPKVALSNNIIGETPYENISFDALELTKSISAIEVSAFAFPSPAVVCEEEYDGISMRINNDSEKPIQILLGESSIGFNGRLTGFEGKERIATIPPKSSYVFKLSPRGIRTRESLRYDVYVFHNEPVINDFHFLEGIITLAVRTEKQDRKYYVLDVKVN